MRGEPAIVTPSTEEYRRLVDACSGVVTPCAAEPELWFSDDPSELAEACQACNWCPAVVECVLYVESLTPRQLREHCGVWAGEVRPCKAPYVRKTCTERKETARV